MKIAVIIERADIRLGGAERSVSELAEALRNEGHDVTLLAATGENCPNDTVLLCPEFANKRTPYYTFEAAVEKHLSENNYDIVHSVIPFEFADVYQPRGGAYPESIIRNAASYRNPVIGYYKRITAFANLRRLPLVRAEKKLCSPENSTVVAALSNYVARQFNKHYNLPEERLRIITNGIKLPAIPVEQNEIRRKKLNEWGIRETGSQQCMVFLFAAHNFRLKGLKFLLEAFASASRKAANPAYLVVIGKARTAPYKKIARNCGISDKVIFRPPAYNLKDSITACDVTALPTFYDPCSRFTLESLALLRPVITTSYNGACDVFTDGRHGMVVDSPDDTTALSNAVCTFTNPQNAGQASRAISEDNLRARISNERVAGELTALYKSVIS